jgi:cytochrome c oxidase cbb3-type subunit I
MSGAASIAFEIPSHGKSSPYNNRVIRQFTLATIFWGVVAFFAGTFIALQLAFPALNLGLEWTTFGRL